MAGNIIKFPNKKGTDKIPVLVVDHRSAYTKKVIDLYKNHPEITYDITVKTDEEIRKLKETDPTGKFLKKYHIIDQAGSRNKKNLNDESARYILDHAHPDTHILNRCFSAQVLANYNGVDVVRLEEYQNGKQGIKFHKGKRKGNTEYIHKAHQWAIPVTADSDSKLELIASSDQDLGGKEKRQIHEIFRSRKNPRHVGIQGHGEQGVGKELMYDLLNDIHDVGYKKKYDKAEPKGLKKPKIGPKEAKEVLDTYGHVAA